MKTSVPVLSAFMILVLSWAIVMSGCDPEEAHAVKGQIFYGADTKTVFDLNNQVQASQLITTLAKETAEIKILKDAVIIVLTDSQGDYKAISVTYQADNRITKMIIPLSEISSAKQGMMAGPKPKGNIWYGLSPDACTMKCTIVSGCANSTHEVIERCTNQKCSCDDGRGEAGASVNF